METIGLECHHEYCWGCLTDWRNIEEWDTDEWYMHQNGCPGTQDYLDAEDDDYDYRDDPDEYDYAPEEPDEHAPDKPHGHPPDESDHDEDRTPTNTGWNHHQDRTPTNIGWIHDGDWPVTETAPGGWTEIPTVGRGQGDLHPSWNEITAAHPSWNEIPPADWGQGDPHPTANRDRLE